MMRHFYSDRREVQVDECPNCGGVWLDPGELAQVRLEMLDRKDAADAAREYFRKVFGPGFTPYGSSGGSGA